MTSDFPSDAERSNETRETGNNAFARLEKEMANMRDAIGGLSDQISDAASDIGTVAQEQARRGLETCPRQYGLHGVRRIRSTGRCRQHGPVAGLSLGDTLEDAIQERPLSTLAFALGLGFLAGVIWRR